MIQGRFGSPKWSVTSAGVGTILWLAAPLLPVGVSPSFGEIEHLFVFMPLVAAPLGILLLSALLRSGSSQPFYFVAQYTQPVTAAMVLASFFVPKGALAGGLAAGWLGTTVVLAIGGLGRMPGQTGSRLSNVNLFAAHLFLPIGAVWLLLSRLGVGPRNFAPLTVFLAAVHFHYSGFTLQILIAATGRLLQDTRSPLGTLHRCLSIGAVAGIPIIAAGNVLPSPVLKFLGVSLLVLSTIALAITSTSVALGTRAPMARRLLLVSAASIAAAMIFAGVYGLGELTGAGWVGIPRMVAIHGLLNSLGFTLCGLIGHLLLRPA